MLPSKACDAALQLTLCPVTFQTALSLTRVHSHPPTQVHKRSARLVYLPAYIMEYSYGEKYVAGDSTGTIVPELFTALVGGTRAGRVAAELHPSATKVQLTVGGGMIGLGYGLGPAFSQLTGLPALVNLDLVGLTFWSFLVASFVGEGAAGAAAAAVLSSCCLLLVQWHVMPRQQWRR